METFVIPLWHAWIYRALHFLSHSALFITDNANIKTASIVETTRITDIFVGITNLKWPTETIKMLIREKPPHLWCDTLPNGPANLFRHLAPCLTITAITGASQRSHGALSARLTEISSTQQCAMRKSCFKWCNASSVMSFRHMSLLGPQHPW